MFIGRTQELEHLNKLYRSSRFQMAVIYGRRRIGKTRMIQEFIKDKKAIYMMGIESSLSANLELFSRSVYHTFLSEEDTAVMPPFASLSAIFQYITKKAVGEKIVLVIDEYPYLAQADRSLSSLLQNLIDREWKQMNLMVILCGSSMSFMENQVLGYQSPLYGRRTAQFRLEALDYYESGQFVPHYTAEEKATVYGLTGGVPQYLEMIDDSMTLKENVMELYLNPHAYLYEEPSSLLKQEMREPATYNAIIEAIARGAVRLNEIATKVSLETSNVSTCLKALISLGLVEKECAITEEDNKKKTRYRLADQMFRFWYRYIPQCMFLISSGKAEKAYDTIIKPDLQHYMGAIFEQMSIQHMQWLNCQGQLPFDVLQLGRWWGNNPKAKRQEEIDILGVNLQEHRGIFGECKFRNEPLNSSVVQTLFERSELFAQFKEKNYIFYSKSGFSPDVAALRENDPSIRLVSLENMYER